MPTPYFNGQSAIQPVSPGVTGSVQQQIIGTANSLLSAALLIVGIAAVFFLVLAGLRYITSGGDPERAKQARSGLIHVVIGIVIVVATFTIIKMAVGFGQSISQ